MESIVIVILNLLLLVQLKDEAADRFRGGLVRTGYGALVSV